MDKNTKNTVLFASVIGTSGLPCHKYLLKSLTTNNDAKVFVKNYVITMKTVGMKDEDIEKSLYFFPSIADKLNGGYDFATWDKHIEGFSLIDDIMFDNDVAQFKNCRQYYRKIDTKCTACSLCPAASVYKNANMDAEKNVILYALASRENLSYVLEKGISADLFTSVTDVVANKMVSSKPHLYPFYKNTMLALCDPVMSNTLFSFESDYEAVLETYHAKKIGNISSIEKDCSFSLDVFCSVMVNNMLSGEACSKSEVDAYIAAMTPKIEGNLADIMKDAGKQKDAISLTSACNLGVEEILQYDTPQKSKKQTGNRKKKSAQNPVRTDMATSKGSVQSTSKNTFVEITLDSILSGMSASEEVLKEDVLVEESIQQEEMVMNREVINEEEEIIPEARKEVFVDEACDCEPDDSENLCVPSVTVTAESAKESVITVTEIPIEEEIIKASENDMVGIPMVDIGELKHFALNLDEGNSHLLSLFESHVLKDKRLSLEVVCVSDNDFYLLLYSPRLHAYFYTKCGDISVREILAPLLSHRSIEKFCYYPYTLLSVLRKLYMPVRSIYSLFSMSRVKYGSHSMGMGMMLEELGAVKAVGGVTVRPEGDIKSIPLLYMHCYHNLYYRNKRSLLKTGAWNEFEVSNTFDMVLGMSYHQNLYSRNNDYLFWLSNANGYVFRKKLSDGFNCPGKKICLSLRYVPAGMESIILHLLCRMYEYDMFFKTDILILSMSDDFVSFYILDQDVDYVETKINRLLLSYLHQKELRGVEYHLQEIVDDSACAV